MQGINSGNSFTKDEEEILEKKGVMFMRKDGTIPLRDINGLNLQVRSARYSDQIGEGATWGVIQAQSGEFVVPDVPNLLILPLTPGVCLVKNSPNGTIVHSNVAEINRAVVAACHSYFFAQDIWKCPM